MAYDTVAVRELLCPVDQAEAYRLNWIGPATAIRRKPTNFASLALQKYKQVNGTL